MLNNGYFASIALFEALKEREQIAELVGSKNFVEALRHQTRCFPAGGFDVGVAEDAHCAAGVAEGGGGVGFVGDQTGELVVVLQGDDVIVVALGDGAAWEDDGFK